MQSDEAVDLAVEGCVLAAAERHMAECEQRDGGKCWECASFHELLASDSINPGFARQLSFCGACIDADGCVTIVDRSERHSADECWEEDRCS